MVSARFRRETVAVKHVRVGRVTEEVVLRFRNEILSTSKLRHQNMVFMLGACWDQGPDRLALVLEFCSRGTVQGLLDAGMSARRWQGQQQMLLPPQPLSWAMALSEMALGVCRAVRYLHWDLSVPMLHRDIKPGNILVAHDNTSKLSDFGSARSLPAAGGVAADEDADPSQQQEALTCIGTPMYMAPEMVSAQPYARGVDVYALSFTLLEMIEADTVRIKREFRKRPKTDIRSWSYSPVATAATVQDLPGEWALVQAMWSKDPSARPTIIEVCDELARCIAGARSDNNGTREAREQHPVVSTAPQQPLDHLQRAGGGGSDRYPSSAVTAAEESDSSPTRSSAPQTPMDVLRARATELHATIASCEAKRVAHFRELEGVRAAAKELLSVGQL